MTTKPTFLLNWATSAGSDVVTGLLIDNINFQALGASGYIVRYSFEGSPDLSSVLTGHFLQVTATTYEENAGQYKITNVDDVTKFVDVINNARPDNTKDETGSPGTAKIIDDGAVLTDISQAKQSHGFASPEHPSDGLFNQLFNNVFNWIQYLSAVVIDLYDDIPALKAVDTTNLLDNSMVLVPGFGAYRLILSDTTDPDDTYYIQPTTGPGRWVLLFPDFDHFLSLLSEETGINKYFIDELDLRVTNLE